jgi:hypothetical protein
VTEPSHPSSEDIKSTSATPTGFWQVPPDVWTDERAMDQLVQQVSDHMTAAHERAEVGREKASRGD